MKPYPWAMQPQQDQTPKRDFFGEARTLEVTYECYTCTDSFTCTYDFGDQIPEYVYHEECPEDPSWDRSK